MYNLYQSQLRQDIQTIVYERPSMTVNIFGKDYFAIIKPKKIGPIKAQWIQIMGVELPTDREYVIAEIKRVKKELSKKQTNILLQLGIVNEMISFENVSHRSDDFQLDMKHMRLNLQNFLQKHYKFKVAFRENMPMSDIIIDVSKPDDQLLQEMNSGSRQRIKKAIGLYDQKNIIYLYGFTNRNFGNIGSHHYLKYRMFSRARDNGFVYCDLMGGAPTGFPDHHLASVSAFKESLGGIKIEQYGSYDIPLNPLLYHHFKRYHKLRK